RRLLRAAKIMNQNSSDSGIPQRFTSLGYRSSCLLDHRWIVTTMFADAFKTTPDVVGDVLARVLFVLQIVDNRIRPERGVQSTVAVLRFGNDRSVETTAGTDQNLRLRKTPERNDQLRDDGRALSVRRLVKRVDRHGDFATEPTDLRDQSLVIYEGLLASFNLIRLCQSACAIIERLALGVHRDVDRANGRNWVGTLIDR